MPYPDHRRRQRLVELAQVWFFRTFYSAIAVSVLLLAIFRPLK